MLFRSAVISAFLFASAVLADRRSEQHHSRFLNRVEQRSGPVSYTNYFAGAYYQRGEGTFDSVQGTFTVPTLSPSDGEGGAVASVSINAIANPGHCLLAGVVFLIDDKGNPYYEAVSMWLPKTTHGYNHVELPIYPGDVISLSVNLDSPTAGWTIIENRTRGMLKMQHFEDMQALSMVDAEWMISTYDRQPLINFGTVTFTDAKASCSGSSCTPGNAQLYEINQGSGVLTSVQSYQDSLTIRRE